MRRPRFSLLASVIAFPRPGRRTDSIFLEAVGQVRQHQYSIPAPDGIAALPYLFMFALHPARPVSCALRML
jgi:hypothetical protein